MKTVEAKAIYTLAMFLAIKKVPKKKLFVAFPWAGRVYDMCVYHMKGTPKGSTESGFMKKPGIEPATPGLQGIALIHYTTEASQSSIGQG